MNAVIKPVAIIQHTPVGHPGEVLTVLDELNIPWQIFSLPDGDTIPSDIDLFSGLITMGGAMSANDDLAWLKKEKALIVAAYEKRIPIAGHCLGSQIMSKALGAKVSKNPPKELGWLEVAAVNINKEQAVKWFGEPAEAIEVFQWHGDTFELPTDAVHLLSSAVCENQAYVLDDIHIAMQFHLEMTPHLVEVSLAANGHEISTELAKNNKAANTESEVRQGVTDYMPAMHHMLRHVYSCWVKNLSL